MSGMQAYAEAVAHAIAEIGISCYVEGKGIACAYGAADIKTVAEATATAFARGYAEAISDCGKCSASVEAIAEAVSSVIVKAYAEAYNEVCLGAPRPPPTLRAVLCAIPSGACCASCSACIDGQPWMRGVAPDWLF